MTFKVYLIVEGLGHGLKSEFWVVKAFTTREKAEEYIRKVWSVSTKDGRWMAHDKWVEIEELEVD